MKFEIGVLLTLAGLILSVGSGRDVIKRKWPKVGELHLDLVFAAISVLGVVITILQNREDQQERLVLQGHVDQASRTASNAVATTWTNSETIGKISKGLDGVNSNLSHVEEAISIQQPGLHLLDKRTSPENGKIKTRFVFGSASGDVLGVYSAQLQFASPYEKVTSRVSFRGGISSIGHSPDQTSEPQSKTVYSFKGSDLRGAYVLLEFTADQPLDAQISIPSPK